MTAKTVLVIDDNPANLKLIRVLLSVEGLDVLTATDAEKALRSLEILRTSENRRPDLVLTDLQLPGMDGLELTRRLKADPFTRDIPVVAITAFAMKGDREKAMAAGCAGFVTKPIDTRTLPELVREILEKSPASGGVP